MTGSPGPAVSHRGPRSNVWHARTPPPRRGSRERAPEWSSGPRPASWQPQTPAHCLAHRTPPRPGAAGGPPQWSSGPGPASWQPRTPAHRVASSPCPEYPSSPDQVLVPRTGYCIFRKMGAMSFPIFPVSLSRPPSRARPGRTTNGDGATSLGQAPSYTSVVNTNRYTFTSGPMLYKSPSRAGGAVPLIPPGRGRGTPAPPGPGTRYP